MKPTQSLVHYQKIWIDVTDMLGWTGRYTGIQRLVHEYSVRFKEAYGINVRFFAYDEVQQKFYEVFDPPFLKQAQAGTYSDNEMALPNNYVKTFAKKTYKASGKIAKKIVPQKYHSTMSRTARSIVGKPAGTNTLRNLNPPEVNAPFSGEDLVIIFGGNWERRGYAHNIKRCKEQKAFYLVHFIHDMIPSMCPQWASPGADSVFGPYMKNILEAADTIFTISDSTKRDILRFIEERKVKISGNLKMMTIRLGDNPLNRALKPKKPKQIDESPFVITVGTLEIRKNHILLYQAYREAHRRGIDLPNLYIIGRQGWMADATVHMIKNDPQLQGRLAILDDISDEELAWLYMNSNYVVYPSIYEGWGLPVAEALAYGKLCISSDQSSMPEIAGDLIDYVSPFSTNDLIETMVKYSDEARLSRKENEIQKNYHLFSWDDAFLQIRNELKP